MLKFKKKKLKLNVINRETKCDFNYNSSSLLLTFFLNVFCFCDSEAFMNSLFEALARWILIIYFCLFCFQKTGNWCVCLCVCGVCGSVSLKKIKLISMIKVTHGHFQSLSLIKYENAYTRKNNIWFIELYFIYKKNW